MMRWFSSVSLMHALYITTYVRSLFIGCSLVFRVSRRSCIQWFLLLGKKFARAPGKRLLTVNVPVLLLFVLSTTIPVGTGIVV
jgi:hypothetical protein